MFTLAKLIFLTPLPVWNTRSVEQVEIFEMEHLGSSCILAKTNRHIICDERAVVWGFRAGEGKGSPHNERYSRRALVEKKGMTWRASAPVWRLRVWSHREAGATFDGKIKSCQVVVWARGTNHKIRREKTSYKLWQRDSLLKSSITCWCYY